LGKVIFSGEYAAGSAYKRSRVGIEIPMGDVTVDLGYAENSRFDLRTFQGGVTLPMGNVPIRISIELTSIIHESSIPFRHVDVVVFCEAV